MVQPEEIRIPAARGRHIRAAFARSHVGDPPRPALVVLHEILGLNDDMRRIAARFAEEGYVALAPDLFEGRGPLPVCIVRALRNIHRGGGPMAEDVVAARAWLAEREDVDAARIGVVGFCMGGSFALLVTQQATFAVAAPFYGGVPHDLGTLTNLCPVVGGWGGRDMVFAEHGRRLKAHLEALNIPHDVEIYEDAGHSYMSPRGSAVLRTAGALPPLRAAYDESAAEDSWRRLFAFFAEHL